MLLNEEDDNLIRRYLLGELQNQPELAQQVEERLLGEDDFVTHFDLVEAELLDDYQSTRLNTRERAAFEQHYLLTPQRWQQLALTMALHRYAVQKNEAPMSPARSASVLAVPQPTGATWQWLFTPAWRGAVTALLLCGIGFGIWRLFFASSAIEQGLAALNAAYRQERPLETRITGLSYAPWSEKRGNEQPAFDYVERDRAVNLILNATQNSSAEALHALGRLYLTGKEFEKAIEQLEKALKTAPADASLHCDLGVALLEQAQTESLGKTSGATPTQLAQSLEHFNKALALSPNLLEARFNRALLYQHLELRQEALADLVEYLKIDPSSRWGEEVRQRQKTLEDQNKRSSLTPPQLLDKFSTAFQADNRETAWELLRQNYGKNGNLVLDQLLDAWLQPTATTERITPHQPSQLFTFAAELSAQKVNDRFGIDVARFYQSATAQQRATSLQARALVRLAQQQTDLGKEQEAIELFSRARGIFERLHNTSEMLAAEYWISLALYHQNDLTSSQQRFIQLATHCERLKYNWLLERSFYGLSGVWFKQGKYSKAIAAGVRMLKLAETNQDTTAMLYALSTLIEYHRYLGSYHEALNYIQLSLPLINQGYFGQISLWRHNGIVASTFNSLGFHALSLDYQKEALQLALATGEMSLISVSYAHLGLIYGNSQNYPEALRYATLAYDTASPHSTKPEGKNVLAYAALQLGHLNRLAGHCESALAQYAEALELYQQVGVPVHIYQAYKGSFICHLALNQQQLAEKALGATLRLAEEHRAKIFDEETRNSFFDLEQNIYDLAIDFAQTKLSDTAKAFAYSESSRARSLLARLSNTERTLANLATNPSTRRATNPFELKDLQRLLPTQTAILQYNVLQDKLLIWLITATDVRVKEKTITQKALNDLVMLYLSRINKVSSASTEEARLTGKQLYETLISPIEPLLKTDHLIYFIPDKILNYLPFSALVSPHTGNYFVQDFQLAMTPSASIFAHASELARKKPALLQERILCVGNPSFDRQAFPMLPDLPNTRREAVAVAANYATSRILLDQDARKQIIQSEMERSDVIHLALHALTDEKSPLNSGLVLARAPTRLGSKMTGGDLLQAEEIYHFNLQKSRLVVLSACQSGVERYYQGEGMIGLACPFLAAGVPLVVASLWPVDSEATSELMRNFHYQRKHNRLTTVEALRQAQLDWLNQSEPSYRHPYYWAAFTVIGGFASF